MRSVVLVHLLKLLAVRHILLEAVVVGLQGRGAGSHCNYSVKNFKINMHSADHVKVRCRDSDSEKDIVRVPIHFSNMSVTFESMFCQTHESDDTPI